MTVIRRPVSMELKKSYLDYSMSVIVSRALPDVRDGLKPVHRRILYTMREGGYDHRHPHRKSARICGDVLGKFHPHGDNSCYDALVRLAQPWAMRVPLIDGQGNFGSIDGDPPAAMRYTEARLAGIADELLDDIDKDTVDFVDNYDGSLREPTVLPARFANVLVNGATGIAVGMSTSIPPHNLHEVIEATIYLMKNPNARDSSLRDRLPGPDFPTGGTIMNAEALAEIYATGRGTIQLRGTVRRETKARRIRLVITEIPYQVRKLNLLEKITSLVEEKKIDGISAVRDESDREGLRIVIELKSAANADEIENTLYRATNLQVNYSVQMLVLHNGRPQTFGVREILDAFIDYRRAAVVRRTRFVVESLRRRGRHLLALSLIATRQDEILSKIRKAESTESARQDLLSTHWPIKAVMPWVKLIQPELDTNSVYHLDSEQVQSILDMRIGRLTRSLKAEHTMKLDQLRDEIQDCLDILASPDKLDKLIIAEMNDIKRRFGKNRSTTLGFSLVEQAM